MTFEQGGDGRIWIRSSSLGSFAACPRHYIAQREEKKETLKDAHPDAVQEERPGAYKTVVGTAFHYCMEHDLQDEAEVAKAADSILRDGLEENPDNFYDERFKEIEQLVEIVQQMVAFFRGSQHSREWTTEREGNRYEVKVESDKIDSGIKFTGNIDCVRPDGMILDLKTGQTSDMNLHIEQLTAYRLLLEHAEGIKGQSHAEVVKVHRPLSPKSKPETMKSARYRIDTKIHVERVIKIVKEAAELVAQKDQWKHNFTVIPANPASKACSYCILRNSSACPETKRDEL